MDEAHQHFLLAPKKKGEYLMTCKLYKNFILSDKLHFSGCEKNIKISVMELSDEERCLTGISCETINKNIRF